MDPGSERGQASVEWTGLVTLVALALLAAITALGGGLPGADLARAVAAKAVCAASLGDRCADPEAELERQYGLEIAELLRRHAPTIHFRDGSRYLPVDHRECRAPACAEASGSGAVSTSAEGLAATAFTRVVDCRPPALAGTEDAGADCSGERIDSLYLQYWLYYPESRTRPWGRLGHHADDWESLQVRIRSGETDARASSHRSYSHGGGIRNWPADAGVWRRSGWGRYGGELHVAAGSHAGHVRSDERGVRHTPGDRLRLLPIEPIGAEVGARHDFEVAPPWRKEVYEDPEARTT